MDYSICTFCDGRCPVGFEKGDAPQLVPTSPFGAKLCAKALRYMEYRNHPDRITTPLKNLGTRGNPVWQPISWDQALDEIAQRLEAVIEEYGPEAVAVSDMMQNHGAAGVVRRFMNCIGTPNYITGMELCVGNTAQVHRAVYGWYCSPVWDIADCIVYFGQDRGTESWPIEMAKLDAALARGAKLIVIDPRRTATAQKATHHLRIKYGTDSALILAWINVAIEENLYDADFVSAFCEGFDELAQHVHDKTPEWAASICGIDAEVIRKTARVYAGAQAAIIPWGVVGDMQSNSTSVIQGQCILRAICGYLNKSEMVFGPGAGYVTNAELQAFEKLPAEMVDKQLGADKHPLLTLRTKPLYDEANARFGITATQDIASGGADAVPPYVFAAMRGEGPYPVKAFLSFANNAVMGYAGQKGIVDAILNQNLVVVYEHWMTPTAQLADYVLPGDAWFERDALDVLFDITPMIRPLKAVVETVGECRPLYDVLKGLADRMGFEQDFPWSNARELYDYRLAPMGMTFDEAYEKAPEPIMGQTPARGQFVTPSGKVELKSSVLEALGFFPLPTYIEPADPGAAGGDFPYVMFAGSRERPYYNTNFHQMEYARKRQPYPELFINPDDAAREGIENGDWCRVSSAYGSVTLKARLDEAQPAASLRIPHGWWDPMAEKGLVNDLAKANLYNDGMVFPDAEWNLDPAQGLPNLRGGIHGHVEKL